MHNFNPSNCVFLCAGGVRPRIEIHDINSSEIYKVIHMPAFHSIYAIDVDILNNRLCVGTKGGLIIICRQILSANDEQPSVHSFTQGAPILALCRLKAGELVVSDTFGRCLLWKPGQHPSPRPLPTSTSPFCSLCSLPDSQVAGLAINGTLVLWDPLENRIVSRHRVPPPPEPSALASMVYWPEAGSIAFPARTGDVILYHLTDNRFDILKAHEGALYALAMRNGHLLSVGAEEGLLKTWSASEDHPLDVFKAPKGITSLTITGKLGDHAVLVDIHGKAQLSRWCRNGRVTNHFFADRDYRLAAAPAQSAVNTFIRREKRRSVNQLLHQLALKNGNMSASDREEKYREIASFGFPHIVLALKAEQFERSGQLSESLKMRHEMLEILPTDDHKTTPSLFKYAKNLEAVWQIQAAYSQYLRIRSNDETSDTEEQRIQLRPVVRILDEENWIIEPDIPLETIIKSHTITGSPFYGRYVLHRLQTLNCNQVIIDAAMIAEKYIQIHRCNSNGAVAASTWLISRSGFQQRAMVFFDPVEKNQNPGLILAWDVFQSNHETHITPLVLFSEQAPKKEADSQKLNGAALAQLRRIENNRDLPQQMAALHKDAHLVLRRILTAKLSRERRRL